MRSPRLGGGEVIQLLTGDCREVMRGMEAGSVQCVVTSPPYWGLRDYGTEGQVWGGEEECEHRWGEELTRTLEVGSKRSPTYYDGVKWKEEHHERYKPVQSETSSAFCSLCGAWRGNLGLEPTPDCGRPMVELRPGLTDKERAYVLSELNRLGLIDTGPQGYEDQQSRDEGAHDAASNDKEGIA